MRDKKSHERAIKAAASGNVNLCCDTRLVDDVNIA